MPTQILLTQKKEQHMIDMDQRKTGNLNLGLKGNIVKDILRKINFKKFSEHFLVEAWE